MAITMATMGRLMKKRAIAPYLSCFPVGEAGAPADAS